MATTFPVLTETRHDGGFIISRAPGTQSFDAAQLGGLAKIPVGAVLGKLTASGLYVPVAPAAVDGSQVAVALLYGARDTTGGTKPATVVSRGCEVQGKELFFTTGMTAPQIAVATAQLAAAGILVR
jgi:hypothetical protein